MTDLVRVWIVPAGVPADTAARCRAVLDDGERARAQALHNPRDRDVFTVAHGAVRILAARQLETRPSALTWTVGPNGKPELAALHTNLSHSAELIVVAISTSRPVGVDVQAVAPHLDTAGLAARYFLADEAGYVAAGRDAGARAERFAHLWARKEAVVKASGGRLWPNLQIAVRGRDVVSCADPAGPHRVADVAAPPGYRAAVALTGAAPFTVTAATWT